MATFSYSGLLHLSRKLLQVFSPQRLKSVGRRRCRSRLRSHLITRRINRPRSRITREFSFVISVYVRWYWACRIEALISLADISREIRLAVISHSGILLSELRFAVTNHLRSLSVV